MSLPTIDVAQAKRLVDEGAVLIDIREDDERAREHVVGARHNPMSRLSPVDPRDAKAVIFHCRSGARTAANAQRLAAATKCEAYILAGGLEAWKVADRLKTQNVAVLLSLNFPKRTAAASPDADPGVLFATTPESLLSHPPRPRKKKRR